MSKTKLIINLLEENNIIYNYNDVEHLKKTIDEMIKSEIQKGSHIKTKDNRESIYNCLTIDFSNFEAYLNKKLLDEIDNLQGLKLIKISTIGITTNSFSVEDIETNIKEIGFAKENTIFFNNEKMKLEDYYNKKYTKKNIEKINKMKLCEEGDFIYIILENNINQKTQVSTITSMLYTLLYSEIDFFQSEILKYQSMSDNTKQSPGFCYIYNKRVINFYDTKNKAPIFKPPFESTIPNDWFSDYKGLKQKYKKRIMNFSFNIYKSFISQETDRFDNICKAIDSLFGINVKVGESIEKNLKNIRNKYLDNTDYNIILTNKKIEIYWKIRNDLIHGEIKDIKDSKHYVKYYSMYGREIENDFLDILFLILKYSTKYFKNNMFIE